MSVDRHVEGYNPDFDIDYEYGKQGELFVTSVARAMKEGRVEVKRDGRFAETGNIYVEYECRGRDGVWRPSGIALKDNPPDLWVFVLGDSETALVIPTERLKAVCRPLFRQGRTAEERDGSNPTRGVLVKVSHLMAEIRRWDVAGRKQEAA